VVETQCSSYQANEATNQPSNVQESVIELELESSNLFLLTGLVLFCIGQTQLRHLLVLNIFDLIPNESETKIFGSLDIKELIPLVIF